MAHLVGYGMMSTEDSAYYGHLANAQCDFCGRLYGSPDEAKKCENKHINAMMSNHCFDVRKSAEGGTGEDD